MAASENDSPKQKQIAEDYIKHQKHAARQSRMELSKSDMLQLLSHLETELQARDHVIATLKAEKAKHFLYQAKYGRFSLSDPLYAIQRDWDAERNAAVRAMYDDPLTQLDKLIGRQHEVEMQMKEQLQVIDKRYYKVCIELEEEKWKHNHDLEQGDSVVFMLEKDRERLQKEVELERNQNKSLEAHIQSSSDELKKFARHREVVLKLLKKRSQILNEISDTQCNITSLKETLQKVESEAKYIEERLSEECSKSLHVEAVAVQQLGVATMEREQLLSQLSLIERQNREICVELERLRSSVTVRHRRNPVTTDDSVAAINFSEGGIASQAKHAHVISAETYVHSSGGIILSPAKALAPVSPALMPSVKVGDSARTDVTSISKYVAGHQIVLVKPGDVRTQSVVESGSSASLPDMVSVTTGTGARISVAVAGPSGLVRKQSPATAAVAGRSIPPPVPPNKPQVSITQPRLLTPPAGATRVIPVAQTSKPQPQVKYGLTFSQDQTAITEKPLLTVAGATASRQAPASSSQTVASSHLTMVVGETSTVHKHPSQVCVNIK